MTAMEEYFPYLSKAYTVMQYTAWAILFLITVWQLFRAFGGPITESEHPVQLIARSSIFALLIGFAKPIFDITLDIARAPYTALLDLRLTSEDFTFGGVQQVLMNGITTIASVTTIIGLILMLILLISLGWNYFKLLLETVERYIVVGVLCYTSPLAFSMGASKTTDQVFKSWCRMVGSQLLLLVLNVWFLRAFNSSAAQFIINGGALTTGRGNIFLWLFCALAFLRTAQKFDSYLAAMGLNVAQTGSSMAMEMVMAAKVLTDLGGGPKSAGSVFQGRASSVAGTAATTGFTAGFASKFSGNSYVRDAVVNGGTRMGAGGGLGFVGRAFGGIAARNGATLTGNSISSVATRPSAVSGSIAGEIADRSLKNYLPQFSGHKLSNTQITGGHISTVSKGADGKTSDVNLYSADQFEKPQGPHSLVTASDGSQWYQTATGEGRSSFFSIPEFTGSMTESSQVTSTFPDAADNTTLRTVENGVLEANTPAGNSLWYSSAFFEEPQAPHSMITDSNGVNWYAIDHSGSIPHFESEPGSDVYNRSAFHDFMPGYEQQIMQVDASQQEDGHFEVRHEDGSGTAFYDTTVYDAPRGDYKVYEDSEGHQWFAIHGDPSVERRPVYENGNPVYDESGNVKSVSVESVRYRNTPNKYGAPEPLRDSEVKPPRKKN